MSVGTARIILGRKKNALLDDEGKAYKGHMAFHENRAQSASRSMVYGAPDALYGKSMALCMARTSMTVAMLNDWAIDEGDIEGAYLNAPLRAPPIYMRAPVHLWGPLGSPFDQRDKHRGPCVRLERALCGITIPVFDLFAEFGRILVDDVGWVRIPGHGNLCKKTVGLLAVYVGGIVLAGTPHARRRELAAMSRALKLKEEPRAISKLPPSIATKIF